MADTKTAKEVIAQGIAELSAQLAAGNSAALTAHLQTIARFHRYSFGNQMAIAMQRPDALRVAGFQTWKTLGRFVKKGEKGIHILAPMVFKREDAATGENVARLGGFRSVCVFDISQTDGADVPTFATVSGDASESLPRLLRFAESQSITIEFAEHLPGNSEGVSYGGRIGLKSGKPDAETFAVLAHELAHEILHKSERRTKGNAETRELEAEATAFIICSAIGLETSTASADYIKLYNGNADALTDSLEAISKASTLILDVITTKSDSVPLAA